MVQIANPIYDSVFKYLMRDEKVAKLLLSAIIGREVVHLEFRPTEHHFPLGEVLTVLRMDFAARIQDDQGKQELVILELQKAKLATDIMRFRKYLGEQYANRENVVRETAGEYTHRKALPILSIYFLGHTLEYVKAPVVRVNRHYTDAATGEVIKEREEFIESLTHDSIIIQIPYLQGRRRTELEQLLALFDQSNQTKDHHFLQIDEGELPKRYRPLLRRLQKALAEPVLRQTMDAEDELIEEFRDYQRLIALKELQIQEREKILFEKDISIMEKDKFILEKEKALGEKDKSILEKEKALGEKDKSILEKEKALGEKDKSILEKEKALEEKDNTIALAIRQLFAGGTKVEELAALFRLTKEEIHSMLGEKN
jgi:hypothetical protein